MANTTYKTEFGSLEHYRKGGIELTRGNVRHYAFSNVFEVASRAMPYEKIVVGKNLEYVLEVLRAERISPWFTCAHDEFALLLDGEVRVDFIAPAQPPASGRGTQLAGDAPTGKPMGHVVLRKGHQALLPAGAFYRFSARGVGVLVVQTRLGALSVEKWADICLH